MEARHQEEGSLILSARCFLATTGAVLQWIETELGNLASQFVDSPLRDAMAEQEIPTDVPTALQEAVESFQENFRELRTSVEKAAHYTKEHLERHWRQHRYRVPEKGGGIG
jgi:hypothetical protein